MSVNPLACPKGVKYGCELCGKTATIHCENCRLTYYCCREHKRTDFSGIHEKICHLLQLVRTPVSVLASARERAAKSLAVSQAQREVVEIAQNEATKFLTKQQYPLAIPGALQVLRFSMEVHGAGHPFLVPAYLLLAEASMGMGKLKQAEQYLSLAKWIVLKQERTAEQGGEDPEVEVARKKAELREKTRREKARQKTLMILGLEDQDVGAGREADEAELLSNPRQLYKLRGQLYRQFGKLYLFQERYPEALKELANDIYFTSLATDPESIETTFGFFHLGNVFYLQQKRQLAFQFYDKIVEIWQRYLKNVLHHQMVLGLTDGQIAESSEIFHRLLTVYRQNSGEDHASTGFVHYTIGLFNLACDDLVSAQEQFTVAKSIFEKAFGVDQVVTQEVALLLQTVSDGTGVDMALGRDGEADEDEAPAAAAADA